MKKKHLFLFSAIILIVIAEIILRICYSKELTIKSFNEVDIFAPDSVVWYTYNPNTEIRLGNEVVKINKQGFLGEDFVIKDSAKYRIAIVGACGVAGTINQNEDEYFGFCPILEELLQSRGANTEVLNCGTDGDNRSYEHYLSIEYKILQYEPDLILLEWDLPLVSQQARRFDYRKYRLTYPLNDPNSLDRMKNMIDNLYSYDKWIKLICHSYIIRSFFYAYKNRYKNQVAYYIRLYQQKKLSLGKYKEFRMSMEESTNLMKSLKDRLSTKDISLFLFQYDKNDSITSIAKQHNLPLISLNIDFTKGDFYHKDAHWNKNGFTKIAEKFDQILTKYQLIPDNYFQ